MRAVELAAADGVVLRGEVWGTGDDWLVLLHDAGSDLDAWRPLRGLEGSLLALDLRGHGGSEGEWSESGAALDAGTAVAFARVEGARTVCVAAAGAAGAPALRAADEVDALVLLSPGPLGGDLSELRAPGVPKLVLVGALDRRADADAAAVAASSIGPALLVSLATARQGTDLLSEPQALEQLTAFLHEQLAWSRAEA